MQPDENQAKLGIRAATALQRLINDSLPRLHHTMETVGLTTAHIRIMILLRQQHQILQAIAAQLDFPDTQTSEGLQHLASLELAAQSDDAWSLTSEGKAVLSGVYGFDHTHVRAATANMGLDELQNAVKAIERFAYPSE